MLNSVWSALGVAVMVPTPSVLIDELIGSGPSTGCHSLNAFVELGLQG